MPFASGERGLQGTRPKPASLAKASTRLSLALVPSAPKAAMADMSSAGHCAGTPPRDAMLSAMHLRSVSRVLPMAPSKKWQREQPSVEVHALKLYSAPSASCMVTSPFQSDWGCAPGGVSNLGWGSAGALPGTVPRVLG